MVGPTHCPTDDDCWLHCIVRLGYDAQCIDGVDRMADVLSAPMPDLWMPQMVLGIHAWIRSVSPQNIGEQSDGHQAADQPL